MRSRWKTLSGITAKRAEEPMMIQAIGFTSISPPLQYPTQRLKNTALGPMISDIIAYIIVIKPVLYHPSPHWTPKSPPCLQHPEPATSTLFVHSIATD